MRRIASPRYDGRWRSRLVALGPLLRSARGRQGLLRDRRGVTALMFGVSALVIIGFVGLATEVGTWYLVRRDAQNVADAAAIAGILAANDAADPNAAAQAVATANGFTDGANTSLGTVAVTTTFYPNYTPVSPSTYDCVLAPPSTTCPAVGVAVSEVVAPLISGLFGGKGVTVGAQSVAWLWPVNACALALTGDLAVTGTLRAPGCGLASNANDSTAINVTGGTLTALTVTAVGGCTPDAACTAPPLIKPAAPYHPPTTNPYAIADAATLPLFSTCTTPPLPDSSGNINPLKPYETNGNVAYCGLTIDGVTTKTVTLQAPGTYFFYNSSLTMTGGTLQCQFCSGTTGVSIVFLGSGGLIGTLTIGAGATVSTVNAGTNTTFPALNGIVFYGRGASPVNVSLQTAAPGPLDGAVYFPNAALTFTGNATTVSNCISLAAASMTLYSTFSLAVTGCPAYSTLVPQMMEPRIVQ